MKKRILLIGMVLSALAILTMPLTALASDTGTVTCTVQAELVSVSVSTGSVSYGILGLDSEQDTTATGTNQTQTATNDGNMDVELTISSSDASGGGAAGIDWSLGTSPGADTFTHSFSTDNGVTWTLLNAGGVLLASNVFTGSSQSFDLKIHTPTSVSDGSAKNITVTVIATLP